ncbi:MAG: hypothetical protein EOP87_13720 [Verrucomicrobiaceae bacterium]|nr:MAG: hypothetical protein EOP87_13720 [Verrucomicrobiaceae bacterium]
MASPDKQIPCVKCATRMATNFIHDAGTGTSTAWCDECLLEDDAASASFAEQVKAARCRYCGGYPCSGGTNIFPLSGGAVPEYRWMCLSCAMEYHTRVRAAFSGMTGHRLTAVQQVALLREAEVTVERHMREFVRMRDN